MDILEFRDYCLTKKGATEETPFGPDVLVFKVQGKMFAATNINTFSSITLKYHPEKIEQLRSEHNAIGVPTYFSKKHWNAVGTVGGLKTSFIEELIDISYNLVVAKLTKKLREELEQL